MTDDSDRVLSNPVLRTALYKDDVKSSRRYLLCIALVLGIAMVAVGPIAGIVTRRAVRKEVAKRQRIDNSKICFAETGGSTAQSCEDDLVVQITLFNVENPDEVTGSAASPVLREVGPYPFRLIEHHSTITYENDLVHFHKEASTFQKDEALCESCDWNLEVAILHENTLKSGSIEAIVRQLWPTQEVDITLGTGADDIALVYNTVSFGSLENVGGKLNGRLFGDSFDSNTASTVFDDWIQSNVTLYSAAGDKYRGVKTAELKLSLSENCVRDGISCEDVLWSETADVVHSLPYLYHENGTSLSSAIYFDRNKHQWRFLVDEKYGFTLHSQTTYQVNHRIDAFGGAGYWAPSHWLLLEYSAPDEEVSFIKQNQRKELLAFCLCDLSVPLLGALIILSTLGFLFFTTSARKRLATIAVLARSRARNARLNPGQFKSLGQFMKNQMRTKTKNQSTVSVSVDTKGTVSNSTASKTEFHDVRSIPNTNSV